jgi:DNA-binding NtrC family response regulator
MLERVLILDPDIHVRDFLYELISEVGFGVLTMPTGQEVLERLKKERPALIIIDDATGEFSGIGLVKKIREFDKDIKIIMLGQEPDIQALDPSLKETNVSAYLKKDFQNPEIIKSILSVLKQERFMKPQGDKKWGRILVVDDEFESRETVGNFLRRRGFETETAASGEECLEKIRQSNFDVVLLDITMDGMDGLLTLKRIMDINNTIKVVMVTALQNKSVLDEAQAIGAIDYIIKPFNFGALESSLLSILLSKKAAPKKS